MRNTFFQYLRLSDADLTQLWNQSTFVFDANVILNMYRYSKKTSNEFLKIIGDLKSRVWLPNQVGIEYYRNRLNVIKEQKNKYIAFQKSINKIVQEVESKKGSPFFSEKITNTLKELQENTVFEINDIISEFDSYINNDIYLNKIIDIFDEKVGAEYTNEELSKIYREGGDRYKSKIPPGFCDKDKAGDDKYGDLVIWNQIMDHSKSAKCDIIFIIDDGKRDWWLEHEGKTISPHPSLIKEFGIQTSKKIHFYKPFQFLEHANTYLTENIQSTTIEEVRNHVDDKLNDNSSLHLKITIKGKKSNLEAFVEELKQYGYKIDTKIRDSDSLHKVFITLPNIPDLERRLHYKYISNIDKYDLVVVSIRSV